MPSLLLQQQEIILSATDLERACLCQLATDTTQDDSATTVAKKKGCSMRIDGAAAVMWALVALITFLFLVSYFTIYPNNNEI